MLTDRLIRVTFLLLSVGALCAPAQVITGTVLGTITDPSRAAVANAKVSVKNVQTNTQVVSQSNSGGEYTVPNLLPGSYEVEIEASGFKAFRLTNIPVGVDSKVRVDAELVVGAVGERVDVVASALTLQTDASDLSASFGQNQIQNLPNIGRNVLSYVRTVPGVVTRSSFESVEGSASSDDGKRAFSNFTVNGSPLRTSEILLDGAPNTNTGYNEIAVLPNLDAIGEMKIITNAYSAEYGRVAGGVITLNTKSGANEWHGSMYEYFRNSALNANSFGNNSFGQKPDGKPVRPKGQFNHNQFGGSIAGPLSIPGLYSGRDKTFFFASYEGVRRVSDASAFFTVPTAAERTGDFSQSRTLVRDGTGQTLAVPRNIYSPFPDTTTINSLGNGQFRLERTQFQDGAILNKIPQRFINPVTAKLLSLMPAPNITPQVADGTLNYFDSNSTRINTDQLILRLDQFAGPNHRFFARSAIDWSRELPPNRYRNAGPEASNAYPLEGFGPTATVGYNWTKSPTTLMELRLNLIRNSYDRVPPPNATDLGALGFSPSMVQAAPNPVFPNFTIVGTTYPEIGPSVLHFKTVRYTHGAIGGSVTKLLHNWTIKAGGEYRPILSNFTQPIYGSLGFRTLAFTGSCAGTGCPTLSATRSESFALADFLIGALDGGRGNGQFTTAEPSLALKNSYWAGFVQNDWKATRQLTLNIGFRYEVQTPQTERYNRLSQFDLTGKNPTGTAGRYVFPGVNGVGRGTTNTDFSNWAPRIGFAFRVTPKTVVRSAYGISYAQTTGIGTVPLAFSTDGFNWPSFMSVRPTTGFDILQNPFQNSLTSLGKPVGANPDDPRLLGLSVLAKDRAGKVPYIQQWNFTIERELPGGTNLQVAYVGTKGTRVYIQSLNVDSTNSIDPAILSSARQEYIRTGANPLAALVANPFFGLIGGNAALNGTLVSRLNLSRPNPAFGAVELFNNPIGSSSYQSLQVFVRKRFAKGVDISANYVWSKNIDFGNPFAGNDGNRENGGGNNTFTIRDFSLERSVSSNDVPHRASIAYIAELPFGRGRALLGGTPVLKDIVGGWKVSGITTFSSGLPMQISGNGFGRPDLVDDPVLPKEYRVYGDGVTPHKLPDGSTIVVPNQRLLYFNPKAFRNRTIQIPTATGVQNVDDVYWYGTAPRFFSNLRTWGINNTDLTVFREFPLKERMHLELRCDVFNAFNRKEFGEVLFGPGRTFGATNLVGTPQQVGFSASPTFGTIDITATGRTPRYLQFAARIMF